MGRKRVTNFGLPADLAELLDFLIREAPGLGFSSRTEVVRAALRQFVTNLVEMKVLPPHAFASGFAKRKKAPMSLQDDAPGERA
jgi:hypothetical protein